MDILRMGLMYRWPHPPVRLYLSWFSENPVGAPVRHVAQDVFTACLSCHYVSLRLTEPMLLKASYLSAKS
jgi:hypothetical protein